MTRSGGSGRAIRDSGGKEREALSFELGVVVGASRDCKKKEKEVKCWGRRGTEINRHGNPESRIFEGRVGREGGCQGAEEF